MLIPYRKHSGGSLPTGAWFHFENNSFWGTPFSAYSKKNIKQVKVSHIDDYIFIVLKPCNTSILMALINEIVKGSLLKRKWTIEPWLRIRKKIEIDVKFAIASLYAIGQTYLQDRVSGSEMRGYCSNKALLSPF